MYLTHGLHRWSARTPHDPALICEGRVTTFAQLKDRVSRIASLLAGVGTERGDRIAILAHNSDYAVEATLAAIWASRVPTNLNTRWAEPEQVYAINDCGCRVLAVDAAFAPRAEALRNQCPELSTVVFMGPGEAPQDAVGVEERLGESEPIPDQNDNPHRLAIINYTSGSTGRAKGVKLSHAGFTHASAAIQGESFFLEGQRAALVAPLFHVTGLSVVLMNMAYGNPVAALPVFEPGAALQMLQDEAITHVVLAPAMLRMLVEHPEFERFDLSRLEYIRYGGSAMPEAVLRRVMDKLPQARLAQVYGQTEIMPLTVLRDAEHAAEGVGTDKLRSAGRPVPYVEVFILDDKGKALQEGEIGEIAGRGLNAMLGYWNKADQTAEVQDGWTVRTGDMGYFDREGYLHLVDRKKDMIVTGGENVYSTEVENALSQHEAVQACAVIACPDEDWGEIVHACVVLKPQARATEEELQGHCRSLIANYKLPRSFEFMSELPLTGAGKVDKVALRNRMRERCHAGSV